MEKNPLNSKGRSHSFTTSCHTQEYEVPDPSWSSNYNLINTKRKLSKDANQNNIDLQQKFDHDVIPVKEPKTNDSATVSLEAGIGDSSKVSTYSELGKFDEKVYDDSAIEYHRKKYNQVLDSSVKFFKSTVQQIFDKFYKNIRDFDQFEKKFHEILENNRDEEVMESFIKDMVHHILTSESSVTYSQKSTSTHDELNLLDARADTGINSNYFPACENSKEESRNRIAELEDGSSNDQRQFHNDINDDIFNIYFTNGSSHVEIKMNNRQLLSEINIKSDNSDTIRNQAASAENIGRLAPKKKESFNFCTQDICSPELDRNIPVKTTDAKKNIHFEGDILDTENRPFMVKICNYLCRLFRKLN